jgi:hypothetical protein
VAGLVIGARRSAITTAQTRLQLHSVYQTVIFLLESVVFALIGLELPMLVRELGRTGRWPLAALAVTGTLIAARVAWVFPVLAFSQRRRGKRRLSWPVPAVVSWAGTRGVVPLAAALSILWVPEIVPSVPELGFLLRPVPGNSSRAGSGSGTVSSRDLPPALPDPRPAVRLAGPATSLRQRQEHRDPGAAPPDRRPATPGRITPAVLG